MAVIARGQYTIADLCDPIVQGTAPAAPVKDMLWLDTSLTPNQLMRWDGAAWVVVNDTEILQEAAERHEASLTVLKDRVNQTVTSETYQKEMATKADISQVRAVEQSVIEQTASEIAFRYNSALTQVSTVDGKLQTLTNKLDSYIVFSAEGITLGQTASPFKTQISNTKISFTQNGVEVAYISNNKLYIKQVEVTESMKMGGFQMTAGSDGGVIIDWMG